MLGVVAVHEVLHDRTALKQSDKFAVGELVGQCRNTPVGVDLQEPRLLP